MKVGIFAVMCGAGVLGGCLAASRLPEVSPEVTAPAHVRQARLPGGGRLVIESTVSSELAGVALVVDAGSAREAAGKEGLAHWVEHLAFRGRHRGEASVEQRLEALSAEWNGFTSHDVVCFHAFAAKSELAQLIQVAADVLTEPLAGVGADVYEHERRVVAAERGFRSDHAPGQVVDWIYQSVYPPEHPYGRPVGGTEASIAALTAADAQAFVQARYLLAHATLYVFSPGVDPTALVYKALAAAAAAPAPPAPPAPAPATALRAAGSLSRQRAAIAAPELLLSWPLPAATPEQRAEAEMLTAVVAIGARPTFASHRAIAGGGCSIDREKAVWLLSCRAILNDTRDLDATVGQMLTSLRSRVSSSDYQQEWFWLIKRHYLLQQALAAEDPTARALSFATDAHDYDNPVDQELVASAIGRLKFETTSRQAFDLMQRAKTYLMLVEPLPGAAMAPVVPTGFATELETDDGQIPLDVRVEGAEQALPRRHLADTKQLRLSNGLTLLVKREATPYSSALLGFRGGRAWLPDPAVGRAAEEAELWGYIEPDPITWGIDLGRERRDDEQWYLARSVGAPFEKSLKVLAATKNAQVEWPNNGFRRAKPALEHYDAAPENRAELGLRQLLYARHPYAAHAPIAELERVSLQAIRRAFSTLHRPEHAALVVVGDVEPEAVRAQAEAELSQWHASTTSEPALAKAELVAPETVVAVEHRPASTQADLELSCLVRFAGAKDLAKARVLAAVLQRRAWMQLRGATGAAYFARASVEPTAAGVLRVDVSTSVSNQHLDAALGLFGRFLHAGPHIDMGAFWLARYKTIRSFAFDVATPNAEALELFEGWRYGISPDELDAMPHLVGAVTQDDVEILLDDCLGRAAISAVGDKPQIEAALAKANVPRHRPF